MSDPISITVGACWLTYAAAQCYGRGGSAVTKEARDVCQAAFTIAEHAERSQALFGDKTKAISELRTLASECSSAGWDGDSAEPLNTIAVQQAEWFVRLLPSDIPTPEFAPNADGDVSLDWIDSKSRIFSVIIGPSNRIAYAWLDGTDSGNGVAQFDNPGIPNRILEGIRGIMGHGATSLRAA
jgi:hypothetical protein